MYNEKFDWETRNDADIIRQYKEIESDPIRMNKAKLCIKDSIAISKKALGKSDIPAPGRHYNPATISKLKTHF